MDRFREIQTFVAVVEAGSFVGAADALRTSKAAVSRSVVDLETRLGARLLHRTTRRLSLTEAGREYFDRSRQLLEDLEEADSLAGMTTSRAVGLLKVNAPLAFGVRHLAPLWGTFLEANPDVRLDITLTDRVVDLVEEGVDVAVRITRMADSSLVSRKLTSSRLMLCATPTYLARHGTPTQLADLAKLPVIGYSYGPFGDAWQLDSADGPQTVQTRPRLTANNGDTCLAAALAHQGIILQPCFLIGGELASGQLVRILPELQGQELGIHAVYPSRKHLSAKVRALVDFLAGAFAGAAWPGKG